MSRQLSFQVHLWGSSRYLGLQDSAVTLLLPQCRNVYFGDDYFDRLITSQFLIADTRKVIYRYLLVTKTSYFNKRTALAIVYAKSWSFLTLLSRGPIFKQIMTSQLSCLNSLGWCLLHHLGALSLSLVYHHSPFSLGLWHRPHLRHGTYTALPPPSPPPMLPPPLLLLFVKLCLSVHDGTRG